MPLLDISIWCMDGNLFYSITIASLVFCICTWRVLFSFWEGHFDISKHYMLMFIANACRYDLLCLEGLARALRIFTGTEATPMYKISCIPRDSMLQMHVKPQVTNWLAIPSFSCFTLYTSFLCFKSVSMAIHFVYVVTYFNFQIIFFKRCEQLSKLEFALFGRLHK